ncbi:MAG: hypothetical protein A3E01_06920 [Gammaproteobacteria bacterium RIFCSPHIGHO2_12_FULL_63_22]|nr:MAG: hypothetical protein A3E01_06920 [Gammaproteobacteria bacterium RIFCSPHIGHO2_12_FULL_63_22]
MTDLSQPRAAFEVLANRLNDAGVPVESVSGNVGAVVVAYAPFATAAQKTQGAAIVAAFDWTLSAEKAAEAAATGNDLPLRQQAEAALVDLRIYRDRATTTTAQDKAFMKLAARVLIGLIRLVLKKLDGAA